MKAPDTLDFVRAQVAALRDLELEKAELETRLERVNKHIAHLCYSELVDVMNTKRVPRIQLAQDGNKPAFEAALSPFYRANIAAAWGADRREAAFSALEQFGAEDLIKTQVTFAFPRGERKAAQKLATQHRALAPKLSEAVSNQTLTAWLREQIESGKPTPPHDTIGAHVGQVVKIKRID